MIARSNHLGAHIPTVMVYISSVGTNVNFVWNCFGDLCISESSSDFEEILSVTVRFRMTYDANTASPLLLLKPKTIFVGLVLNVFDYVGDPFANVVLRSSIIKFLVSGVVKLAVSYGAQFNVCP